MRSSWVTAETKAARRPLSRTTPARSAATAAAAVKTHAQAMPSESRIGERAAVGSRFDDSARHKLPRAAPPASATRFGCRCVAASA